MLTVQHLNVTSDEIASNQPGGRFFFVPGSPERARQIAENFHDLKCYPSARKHDVFTGVLQFGKLGVEVGAVSTGMGCPSVDIIVSELISLGAKRFLRVGTAGSLHPEVVKPGDTVICTGAVRDEGASSAYVPLELPALSSLAIVDGLRRAALALTLEYPVHIGLVHSKDSLIAREFQVGPRALENKQYMDVLARAGVLATEMEAAHLFVLAQVHSGCANSRINKAICSPGDVLAGCILAVVGGEDSFSPKELQIRATAQATKIALECVHVLYQS